LFASCCEGAFYLISALRRALSLARTTPYIPRDDRLARRAAL